MRSEAFNDDWTLTRSNGESTAVALPHDAMIEELRDANCANGHNTGYFPGGRYRYRKTFAKPEAETVILDFEGVYQRSRVLLNGVEVGGRPSGYAQFRVPLENLRDVNELEVIVDNSQEPNSRWYTGSGIYREVRLLTGPGIYIEPTWPRVATAGDTVTVTTKIINTTDAATTVTVNGFVTDPDGDEHVLPTQTAEVPAHGDAVVAQDIHLEDAKRWSPEHPYLHEVRVVVTASGTTDEAPARFGIRDLSVTVDGLKINGEDYKLRGACIHHDNGVLGAATFKDAERRRVRLLKEAGFNAIRSAHNPASRALLDACDEEGMLVMDEYTDVWARPKNNWDYAIDFPVWWDQDLEAMIENDINHPSVIMYSIGNEIGETAVEAGLEWNKCLANKVRELDASRPVTNCINGLLNLGANADEAKVQAKAQKTRKNGKAATNRGVILLMNMVMGTMSRLMTWILPKPIIDKKTRDAYAQVDVAGYNHTGTRMVADHELHPERVMVGSEETPSLYMKTWRDIQDAPWALGNFVWTGWDYLGEGAIAGARYNDRARMFVPYPALAAGTPVIDITGHRQPQSYAYEIGWGLREDPYIAVRPLTHAKDKMVASNWRSSDSVRSWDWPGFEGADATVEVYAQPGAEVELSLNGTVVGTAKANDDLLCAHFTVPWAPGGLEARTATGTDRLESGVVEFALTPDRETLNANGQDLAFVEVTCPGDGEVQITVEGPGTLQGFGSGNSITAEGYTTGRHSTYYGRALAVVRAGAEPGDILVTARTEGWDPVTTTLTGV